jgi:hypothetical protein
MRSASDSRSRRPRRPDGVKHEQLHGRRVAYRLEGSGPVIALVHGITSSSATWERVIPALAER